MKCLPLIFVLATFLGGCALGDLVIVKVEIGGNGSEAGKTPATQPANDLQTSDEIIEELIRGNS